MAFTGKIDMLPLRQDGSGALRVGETRVLLELVIQAFQDGALEPEGDDRLTIECRPQDCVRWVLVQNLDGQRESAAGETTVKRLPEVLRPYDPSKLWFPHAAYQAPA